MKQKKKFTIKVPDVYILAFSILIIFAILTYILPAGEFAREDLNGLNIIVPGTYESVAQSPVGIMDIFRSIHQGMVASSEIIFLILFTGGMFSVMEKTGAFSAGITATLRAFKGRRYMVIMLFMILFSLGGSTGIITNAVIAFVPIGIIIARGLKLDAIVGASIVIVGTLTGLSIAVISPMTLGLAQSISGVPLFSGMTYRIILLIIFTFISIIFVSLYARKISNNPEKSLLRDDPFPNKKLGDYHLDVLFSWRHKLILTFFFAMILLYSYGLNAHGWGIKEMSAIFIIVSIFSAIIGKIHPEKYIKIFIEGMGKLLYGAAIIGVAQAIIIILTQGKLLDTIIHSFAIVLEPLPSYVGAAGLFIGSSLLNFVVNSGSGQAALTMPIIAPLTDVMGTTRQVGVLAYQLGDGFTNMIYPTSGPLMASLAVAGIPYDKWVKFMAPLILIFTVLGIGAVILGTLIGYGPM